VRFLFFTALKFNFTSPVSWSCLSVTVLDLGPSAVVLYVLCYTDIQILLSESSAL
jgi:hypothetical protein